MLVTWLPRQAMASWGWRVPLWVGCLVIPFLFWIRNSLAETGEFIARRRHPPMREILRSVVRNWRIVGIATMLTTLTTTAFYLITAYTPTYGTSTLHLTRTSAFIVTMCVGICNFSVLPLMGRVSDSIGRRPLLLTCTLAMIATGYPIMMWLVHSPSFSRLLTVELWFSVLYASYNGAMVVYLTEIMPPDVRATGFSLAYSTATALFGGFTPFVCTYLIHITGNKAMPAVWLGLAAAIALAAVVLTQLPGTLLRREIVNEPVIPSAAQAGVRL